MSDQHREERDEEDVAALDAGDRPVTELDDERDRDELRRRYYGLLQELRVLLPGTQMLSAFLLVIPFNSEFAGLDELGRLLYGLALGSATLAIICFIAPTAFHRVGPRRARAARLLWSIRMARAGLVCLGGSLVTGLLLVTRLVFGGATAVVAGVVVTALLVAAWVVLPKLVIPATNGDGVGVDVDRSSL